MTYCLGVMLDTGMIFASDSHTNAGMDNVAKFCKMTVFERHGDRMIVLLSSGNLAGTQAVIGVLNQRCRRDDADNLWGARTMFDVAMLVADAMRDIERRDGEHLQENEVGFNASFIVGGQIGREPLRLFRIYAEGNFIEAGIDTPYFQTGETKYGKPIIDRVITRATPLADAAKCVLVSRSSPHHLWLPARAHDALGAGVVSRQNRRMSRLCAPRDRLLPMHEYSCALLHRLPGRHRHAAAARHTGLRRLVRGVSRRPLVHLRCAQQRSAYRSGIDCARSGMLPTWPSAAPSVATHWQASEYGPMR
jgi:putative proteasome-type protease